MKISGSLEGQVSSPCVCFLVSSLPVCVSERLVPADAGGVDGVWYYRHSMAGLSRLRFQLIPGNAAGHEGTVEPNHDAASVRLWRKEWSQSVALRSCVVFSYFLKLKSAPGSL